MEGPSSSSRGPPAVAAHDGPSLRRLGATREAPRRGSDSLETLETLEVTREMKTHFRVCRFIMESGNHKSKYKLN